MDIQFWHNGKHAVIIFPDFTNPVDALEVVRLEYPEASIIPPVADHEIDSGENREFQVKSGYIANYLVGSD